MGRDRTRCTSAVQARHARIASAWQDRARAREHRATAGAPPRAPMGACRNSKECTMRKTWFITGASRGLGAEIAKAALRAGDLVVAAGRQRAAVRDSVGPDSERLESV